MTTKVFCAILRYVRQRKTYKIVFRKADRSPGKENVMRTANFAYNLYSEQILKALEERYEQGLVLMYSYKIRQNNCKNDMTRQGA